MSGTGRLNPLKSDAVTADSVKPGDKLIYWIPGDSGSTHHVTIAGGPYVSGEDDLVVDIIHSDGHESTELTSTLGLTAERYSGVWTTIAIYDEEDGD